MASVTVERIATVHGHIVEALVHTSERTTYSELEQDRLLAQSCAETCDLLQDWLASSWWEQLRPSADGPIGDVVPDLEHFQEFLDPMLTDALAQASRHGVSVPASHVDEARAALQATARRHRRMKRRQLFQLANERINALRQEVCALADHLRTSTKDTAMRDAVRRRARTALTKASGLLVALVLAMGGAGPHQMTQNLSDWGHEVTKLVMVHDIAHHAQPSLRIVPPRAGPRIR